MKPKTTVLGSSNPVVCAVACGLCSAAVLVLLFAWVAGCGTPQMTRLTSPPAVSLPTGAETVITGSDQATTTSLSYEEIARKWYEDGLGMGFWARNVETIPERPKSLPDFFFAGPTPSGPVQTDEQGHPLQKDPATIKKPLWIFGNEIPAADYAQQIRKARDDGRPVLFYATSAAEAASILQLEQRAWAEWPLERLVVSWLPWDDGAGALRTRLWTGDFGAPGVFHMLVAATLTATQPVSNATTTSMDAPRVGADDPSLPPEDSAGCLPGDVVQALIAAKNGHDWQEAYVLYARPEVDYETAAAEWAEANETHEDFLVRETRVVSENFALVRVTYRAETTPPGGQRYAVVIDEPGEWWRVEKVDGLWKVGWLPRQ